MTDQDKRVEQLKRLSAHDLETHGQLLDEAQRAFEWCNRWDGLATRAIGRAKEARERGEACLLAAQKLRASVEDN